MTGGNLTAGPSSVGAIAGGTPRVGRGPDLDLDDERSLAERLFQWALILLWLGVAASALADWQTNLTEITSTEVAYKDAGGVTHRLPNSQVFIFAGGELPTPFLRACGVQIETKFGER